MLIKTFKYLVIFFSLFYSFFSHAWDKCSDLDSSFFEEVTAIHQKVKPIGRLYFYSQPLDESCKQKNLFVISGDSVRAYTSFDDFTFVEYTSKKGIMTSGWVKTEGIEPDVTPPSLGADIDKNDFAIKSNHYHFSLGGFSGPLLGRWMDANLCIESGRGSSIAEKQLIYDDLVAYIAFENTMLPEINTLFMPDCHFDSESSNTIIALKILTNQYQTPRGITVGSSKDDLFKAYNQEELTQQASNECMTNVLNPTCYAIWHNHNILRFILNGEDKIRVVEMSSHPNLLPL